MKFTRSSCWRIVGLAVFGLFYSCAAAGGVTLKELVQAYLASDSDVGYMQSLIEERQQVLASGSVFEPQLSISQFAQWNYRDDFSLGLSPSLSLAIYDSHSRVDGALAELDVKRAEAELAYSRVQGVNLFVRDLFELASLAWTVQELRPVIEAILAQRPGWGASQIDLAAIRPEEYELFQRTRQLRGAHYEATLHADNSTRRAARSSGVSEEAIGDWASDFDVVREALRSSVSETTLEACVRQSPSVRLAENAMFVEEAERQRQEVGALIVRINGGANFVLGNSPNYTLGLSIVANPPVSSGLDVRGSLNADFDRVEQRTVLTWPSRVSVEDYALRISRAEEAYWATVESVVHNFDAASYRYSRFVEDLQIADNNLERLRIALLDADTEQDYLAGLVSLGEALLGRHSQNMSLVSLVMSTATQCGVIAFGGP